MICPDLLTNVHGPGGAGRSGWGSEIKQKLMWRDSLDSINATLIRIVTPDEEPSLPPPPPPHLTPPPLPPPPPPPVQLKSANLDTSRRSMRAWFMGRELMLDARQCAVSTVLSCGCAFWKTQRSFETKKKGLRISCRNLHHPFMGCYWSQTVDREIKKGENVHPHFLRLLDSAVVFNWTADPLQRAVMA